MSKSLILLVILLMVACSSDPNVEFKEGYFWLKERSAEPLPYEWIAVGRGNIRSACPASPWVIPEACAYRNFKEGKCYIYAEEDEAHSPDWLSKHEKHHCEGYNHVNDAYFVPPPVKSDR